MTNIPLFSLPPSPGVKITQLYEHLELFSEGEPPRHTLFILGRPTLAERNPLQAPQDQLLIIDPPANVSTRFRVEGNVATLFTGPAIETGFPLLQTETGGVAHIRIGAHYLDLYSQHHSTVIHLPAVGVLCGGPFGSAVVPPTIAATADGTDELATLRLLAGLIKGRRLQLYIPAVGELGREIVETMGRLAADVAYLHELRRVISPLVARGESAEVIETIAPTLLPSRWRANGEQLHLTNLQHLYEAMRHHVGSDSTTAEE